jgi:hypothetical protein
MSGIVVILVRLLLLYLAVKVIWSLIAGSKNTTTRKQTKASKPAQRFNTNGHTIDDAEYDDIK